MSVLKHIEIDHFELDSGRVINLRLSYQHFGKSLNDAPVVLVNHALTGNSQVSGTNGWWNSLIGNDKTIDTNHYAVLAFNVPGNGFGGVLDSCTEHYKAFKAKDIARLFLEGLRRLQIESLFAIIGGSVGGGIAWHMAFLNPKIAQHLIPIASDWKATDWLVANCYVQERILENSLDPIADARSHAMMLYRTPESLSQKFNRTRAKEATYNVESWLNHHGEKLSNRFQLSAYKIMNQVLKTINVANDNETFLDAAKEITSTIHIVTINSDLFFKPEENWKTYVDLKPLKDNLSIYEIKSIHGHDAFLIEYQQLTTFLKPIFEIKEEKHEDYKYSFVRNR
ncbi:alpha/beta fold hydrolase [Winogradskyella sp.]|uniref:alpha/beta fold hydrolase n=1 Tax=Winogradskyella sp. TaxID=1883156 RepID=UPI0025D96A35|nr:alpha/beta fold hydrolase [Winogradskyella sp.]